MPARPASSRTAPAQPGASRPSAAGMPAFRQPGQTFAPDAFSFVIATPPGCAGPHVVALLANGRETVAVVLAASLAGELSRALLRERPAVQEQPHFARGAMPAVTDRFHAAGFALAAAADASNNGRTGASEAGVHLLLQDGSGCIEFALARDFADEFALGLALVADDIAADAAFDSAAFDSAPFDNVIVAHPFAGLETTAADGGESGEQRRDGSSDTHRGDDGPQGGRMHS